ncbi:MAG TPA: toast rack family protein [Flavilitoribacter sp.]|nr:toast rack family protein [Flavilitoribacter sp.]HMQ88203.1 toast rack family protein [Flavilitoribacter sp.]
MKSSTIRPALFLSAALLLITGFSASGQKGSIQQSYDDIKAVKINIGYGDLTVEKSTSGRVEIAGKYNDDEVDVELKTKGDKLSINEKSSWKGNNKQKSEWTLKLPENTAMTINIGAGESRIKGYSGELEGNTGSGNYYLSAVGGKIRLNSGTGNLEIMDSDGDFSLNSGTGNVKLNKVSGAISANSGTGNVMADNISINGDSGLNSGTGNVSLSLGGPIKGDLALNSGTDNSRLNFNGYNFEGTLVMKCGKDSGKIEAPFGFDSEETEGGGRYDNTLKKTKKFGNSAVEITVATGTGKASVQNK